MTSQDPPPPMRLRPMIAILSIAAGVLAALPAAARPYLMLFADDNGFQALDIGDFVRTPVSPYADDRVLTPVPPPPPPPAPKPKPGPVAKAAPLSLGEYDGLLAYPPPKPKPKRDSRAGALGDEGRAELGDGTEAACVRDDSAANPHPSGAQDTRNTDAASDAVQSDGADNDPEPCLRDPSRRGALVDGDEPKPETFPASGPRLQDSRTQGTLGPREGAARIVRRAPPHPMFFPDRVEATLISAPLAGAPFDDKLAPLVKQRVEFDCHEPRWRVLSRTYTDAHEAVLGTAVSAQEWLPLDVDPAAPLAQAALCKRQYRQAAVSRFLNVGEILANYQAAHGAGVPQPKTREQLLAERFKNSR